MSFTARIRTYLLLIAILPPLAVMAVIYYYSTSEMESSQQIAAQSSLQRYERFQTIHSKALQQRVLLAAESQSVRRAVSFLAVNKPGRADLNDLSAQLDFVEIVDSTNKVLVSRHRPGLVGQPVQRDLDTRLKNRAGCYETVEFDLSGRHIACAYLQPLGQGMSLYAGEYLDGEYMQLAATVMEADLTVEFGQDQATPAENLVRGQIYQLDGTLGALVAGGARSGFYLVARFLPTDNRARFLPLMRVTAVIAFFAILTAVMLGWYITGQAKREIDNLINATSRVASGDFNTPVMAYEEGEFSQLADSFSEMMVNLRNVRQKLAMSEKIAAWQVMGRKVAHEIKNPLTPIAISTDDLRRSYDEKQPDFENILHQTTSMIQSEVRRLTRILDQFVGFARMKPSVKESVSLAELIDSVGALYRTEIDAGRLNLSNNSSRTHFDLDPDQIKQLIVNLIKNGLEAGDKTRVELRLYDHSSALALRVEDDGPGFSEEILQNRFEPQMSKKKDGSGLGLVICGRIAIDHGGNIELYNREDGGAGVLVILPQ